MYTFEDLTNLLRKGDVVHAEEVVDGNPDALYFLGAAAETANVIDAAKTYYSLANTSLSLHNLGCILMSEGKIPHAFQCFSQALDLNPTQFKSATNLGACIIHMDNDFEKAKPYFERVIKMAKDDDNIATAMHNLGFLEMKHGDILEAQRLIEYAYKLNPKYTETLYTLGVLYDGFTLKPFTESAEELKIRSHYLYAEEVGKDIIDITKLSKADDFVTSTIPGVNIYTVHGAMLMCGQVQTENKIIITHHRKQIPVHRWNFNIAAKIKTAINCLQYNSWGFYHWLIETMPRMVATMHNDIPLLLPDKGFVKDFIQTFFPHTKAIFIPAGISVYIDTLYMVDWDSVNRYRSYGNYEFLVPRKILRHAVNEMNLAFPKTQNKVVWLSRKNVKCRRCLNDDEIVIALRQVIPYNYQLVVLTPEDYNVKKTVELFAEAAMVIGIHGGALSNMIYCKRGTFVIEIGMKETFYYSYFKDLADTMGLRHIRIVHDEPNMFNKDIAVDAQQVSSVASKLLEAHRSFEDIFDLAKISSCRNDDDPKTT